MHRNTVLGALSNALRLSYLAIDRLVGEDFFDRMAVEYARAAPPREPQLDVYGSGFAEFIAGFPGTERLPYLSELARLDWQLAELGRERCSPEGGAALLLEGGVRLRFRRTAPHFSIGLRGRSAARGDTGRRCRGARVRWI